LLLGVDGVLTLCILDMQRGAGAAGPETARLDYFTEVTCAVDGHVTLPRFAYNMGTELYAFKTSGENAYLGQRIFNQTVGPTTVDVEIPEAVVGDKYVLGFLYESRFSPTPPIIKDSKDVAITTSRAVIQKYAVSLYNSGQFTYALSDQARPTPIGMDTTPQRLFSGNIAAGQPMVDSATVIIPARLDMRTVNFEMYTSDYYDMNVLSIEYGFRFNQRHRRQ